MSNLKIAIVGAGAVGGYIGAKLIQHDYDVTLVARGKHCEAIKENGLKVLDYKKDSFTVYPYIVENTGDEIYDIVFITTKTYDFQSACKSIKNSIDENTLIIPLSNGVEHKSELSKFIDKGIICDGAIYIISNIEKYGVINRKSITFYLLFGSQIPHENLDVLQQILNQCDLRSKYSNNIKYDCWKKYLFICSMASLTTYFDKPMGYILEEKLESFIDILLEVKKVANEKNIDINNNDIEKAIKQATHVPYESKNIYATRF